ARPRRRDPRRPALRRLRVRAPSRRGVRAPVVLACETRVADEPRILVTGATGKVGQAFIARLVASDDARLAGTTIKALCHNRRGDTGPRVEVVSGSIDRREVVEAAVDGVTHVLHLATSKETRETIIDVSIKGLFWLLEACRASPTCRQLILVGGDAAVGH